ncbi:MAG: sigma-54 dependent transcriptional regulator, partial [Terriglobales bacterium]
TPHRFLEAAGGADALQQLELERCSGLVLDRRLPDLDAGELAGMAALQYPELEIAILDPEAVAEVGPAGEGGVDFRSIMRALQGTRRDVASLQSVSAACAPRPSTEQIAAVLGPSVAMSKPEAAPIVLLSGLVGCSTHLSDISRLVRMVAPRRTSVLLLGETGTGKELIARGIHESSTRANRPWVVVNCAAIPEALLESELFGYARGAFTGAQQSRPGRIIAAHGGTLFLDEIGELPLNLQSKLLRFLQEGELQRLGSNEPQKVDVRVVAATNVNLMAEVEAGRFRRDLYYRLAVFPIELLPLQRRAGDILPLARHFLRHFHAEAGVPLPRLSAAACDLLERHTWPGNVRELQHTLERAFILAGGALIIEPAHFPGLAAR